MVTPRLSRAVSNRSVYSSRTPVPKAVPRSHTPLPQLSLANTSTITFTKYVLALAIIQATQTDSSLQTIQPVVQKETIQPSVVHTTVPIHEVHQNEAKHHAASALPAVSIADFKKQGGSLTGREERYDGFEGEPRAVGGTLGGHHTGTGVGSNASTGYDDTTTGTTGTKSSMMDKLNPRTDADGDGKRGIGS